MDEYFARLEQAFADYRRDLAAFELKKKPASGLFGLGPKLQDDACHDRLDERLKETVEAMAAAGPSPQDAARAVRMLLRPQEGGTPWPLAAQWMLRAVERHVLPLVPFLSAQDAASFLRDYSARYRPWDRLPAQKEVFRALTERAVGKS